MDFSNIELQEVGVGIKFHYPIRLQNEEVTHFFNQLRQKRSKKFENVGFSDTDATKLIFGKRDNRFIIFNPDSVDYRERRLINNSEVTKDIANDILNFYIDYKKIDWEAIKVIGKYFNYSLKLGEDSAKSLVDKLGIFGNETISTCYLKTTAVRHDDKNIHFHIEGKSVHLPEIDEDDEEECEEAKHLNIKVDINNRDQKGVLPVNFFQEIVSFADDFNKNELIDILNSQF